MERSTRAQLNGIRALRSRSCWRLEATLANTKLENRSQVSTTQQSSKTSRFSTPERNGRTAQSRLRVAVFLESLRLGQPSKRRANAYMTPSPGFISKTVITGATLL